MVQHRERLVEMYNAALLAVDGRRVVAEYFNKKQIVNDIYPIALGKAAVSMAQGVIDKLNPLIRRGFIVGPEGGCRLEDSRFEIYSGNHPLPGENSIVAGRELLHFITSLPDDALVLFLVSGGASSMLECLPDVLSLSQLREINRWLLGSGLPISDINAIRRRISAIKGGKLHYWLAGRQSVCLLMSDVQNDDPAIIGSGLLFGSQDMSPMNLPHTMPDTLQQLCRLAELQTTPGVEPVINLRWDIIANNALALQAAKSHAHKLGYTSHVHDEYLTGEAQLLGKALASYIKAHPGIVHIWGGETTVTLPKNPGVGGRCQVMALAAAGELAGSSPAYLLACGTDGRDGPSTNAGALVDHATVSRLKTKADSVIDLHYCLARADTGNCLELAGDVLPAWDTGSNVADLVLGYCP